MRFVSRRSSHKRTKRANLKSKTDTTSGRLGRKKSGPSKAIIIILAIAILSVTGFGIWYFRWFGDTAFDYSLHPVFIVSGHAVNAGDFLDTGFEGMDRVQATFRDPGFQPEAGHQSVPLRLRLYGRSTNVTADLHVLTILDSLQHEYRTPAPELDPIAFITNFDIAAGIPFDIGFTEKPLPLEYYDVGTHTLSLTLNGVPFTVVLNVADTTPPTADPVYLESPIGETVFPRQFIFNEFDHSGIASIMFVNEPDVMAQHIQDVRIRITDFYDNSAVIESRLMILPNETPPVIEGTRKIYSRRGNPIIYLQGVTAHDSFDRDLTDEIRVDSSGVDRNEVGEYQVIYKVTDLTGNETAIVVIVEIITVDIDYVNTHVDALLSDILDEGMSQLEKVREIHKWVRENIHWASSRTEPENVYEGAYRALRDRRGNCFNYYSISEVMLTRAGIPNQRIDRIPGTANRHRWNLINPDGLGWHHFDATPVSRMGFGGHTAFFTASQARFFASRIQSIHGTRNYFTYDPDLYPEIVE